mgnify:CR=1 FL=1
MTSLIIPCVDENIKMLRPRGLGFNFVRCARLSATSVPFPCGGCRISLAGQYRLCYIYHNEKMSPVQFKRNQHNSECSIFITQRIDRRWRDLAKFFLMRHGETAWNQDGNRYCGRTDIPLSDAGKQQAENVARYFRHISFDAIYASPLKRAIETAGPVAGSQSCSIRQDERIIEIDFGLWEGLRKAEIERQFPVEWAKWCDDPAETAAGVNGETATQVFERMNSFFTEKSREHSDGNILVVGHNTAIRLYIAGMLSMPFRSYRLLVQDNTGFSVLEPSDYGMRLHHFNCRCDGFF